MADFIEGYENDKVLYPFATRSDESSISFLFSIKEAYKYHDFSILALLGVPDIKNKYTGILLYCKIPHADGNTNSDGQPTRFKDEILIWVPKDNKFDKDKTNFGNCLNSKFGLQTQNAPCRPCKYPVYMEKCVHFSPLYLFTKQMHLDVRDADDDHLYDLGINWESKKAVFTIPRGQIDTFIKYFFTNDEISCKKGNEIPAGGKIIKTIEIKGFDEKGEPYIEIFDNGKIELIFNFMPPSNTDYGSDDLGDFSCFDRYLKRVIGTTVVWDDRERFIIPEPKKDIVELLKQYLENYWKNRM